MTRDARVPLYVAALAAAAFLGACGGGGTPPASDRTAAAPAPADDAPRPPTPADPPPPDAAAVPTRFQGRYAVDASACTTSGDESRLEIGADHIAFHEGSGPVRSVSADGNMLTLVAELASEGETRDAAYQFGLSEDGGSLHDLANGRARRRCD